MSDLFECKAVVVVYFDAFLITTKKCEFAECFYKYGILGHIAANLCMHSTPCAKSAVFFVSMCMRARI